MKVSNATLHSDLQAKAKDQKQKCHLVCELMALFISWKIVFVHLFSNCCARRLPNGSSAGSLVDLPHHSFEKDALISSTLTSKRTEATKWFGAPTKCIQNLFSACQSWTLTRVEFLWRVFPDSYWLFCSEGSSKAVSTRSTRSPQSPLVCCSLDTSASLHALPERL